MERERGSTEIKIDRWIERGGEYGDTESEQERERKRE
jgi:hypothetical protein